MEYNELFRELQKQDIRYLIAGGLAVTIYGKPSMTNEIEIILDFDEENLIEFEAMMDYFGYVSMVPFPLSSMADKIKRKKEILENDFYNYSFLGLELNSTTISVIIDVPISFDLLWEKHDTRTTEYVPVNLISPQDLFNMKKGSTRLQDIEDSEFLRRLIRDQEYGE